MKEPRDVRNMTLLKASMVKMQIQGRNKCEVKLEGQKEAKPCTMEDLTYELLNLSSPSLDHILTPLWSRP